MFRQSSTLDLLKLYLLLGFPAFCSEGRFSKMPGHAEAIFSFKGKGFKMTSKLTGNLRVARPPPPPQKEKRSE